MCNKGKSHTLMDLIFFSYTQALTSPVPSIFWYNLISSVEKLESSSKSTQYHYITSLFIYHFLKKKKTKNDKDRWVTAIRAGRRDGGGHCWHRWENTLNFSLFKASKGQAEALTITQLFSRS